MTENDTNLLNKYRLNFHCLTSKGSKEKAKQQFLTFADQIYPEQQRDIEAFKNNYKV